MTTNTSRRQFIKTLLASSAGVSLLPGTLTAAAAGEAFAFPLLGDIHYDKLSCHDLERLGREKPDDLRQVREYSALTIDIVPKFFASLRQMIADLNKSPATSVPFTVQVGDLVEGLCGSPDQTRELDKAAVDFVGQEIATPFFFAKGNHDITGPDAVNAFKDVFHPFLGKQAGAFGGETALSCARYRIEHKNALFCFFDAYDKESLPWLEAELARRTARHCFIVLHPPVVPYGARSTWHLFSRENERVSRDRMLQLLGKNNAIVLTGHIHKYSLVVRDVPGAGRFAQLAVSSVIKNPEPKPGNYLSGVNQYNEDQLSVEPGFSPATLEERKAVYRAEAPFVKQFQYADLPGYAVIQVNGSRVTASIYPGIGRAAWRTLDLSNILSA